MQGQAVLRKLTFQRRRRCVQTWRRHRSCWWTYRRSIRSQRSIPQSAMKVGCLHPIVRRESHRRDHRRTDSVSLETFAMPSGQTDSQSPLRPTSAPQCYPQHTQAPQEDRAHLAGKARVVFRAVVPVPPTGLAMDVKIAAGLPVMVVVISTRYCTGSCDHHSFRTRTR